MATYSRILAWRIPQMQEPGGLQSMELQRVRYDLATKRQGRQGHQGVVNGRRSIHQINCFTMSYIMFSNIYSYLLFLWLQQVLVSTWDLRS